MAKKPEKTTLRELIAFIEISVKADTIAADYNDYLNCSRDLGVSSHTLNLLIQKIKEEYKKEARATQQLDYTFLAPRSGRTQTEIGLSAKVTELEELLQKEKSRPKSKLWRRLTLILLFLAIGCGGMLYYYIDKVNTAKSDIMGICSARVIEDFKYGRYTEKTSFYDWESNNHNSGSKSSNTYNFYAIEGDTIFFKYKVESEKDHDLLTVNLKHDQGDSTPRVFSGLDNGESPIILPYNGKYTLNVSYKKDNNGKCMYGDYGKISDIKISRGPLYHKYVELYEIYKSL